MPLGLSLSADIKAVFDSAPATTHAAAVALAQAYYDYVVTSTFGPGIPVILTTARDAMAATLETALNPVTGLAATFAAAWAAAVNAFWLAPPIVCTGAAPGAVNAIPGAPSITGAMTPTLLNLLNTSATASAGMASALMTATTTATALLNVPPPTTFPIS